MAKAKKVPNSFFNLEKILEYDWSIAIGEHTLTLEEFKALVAEQGEFGGVQKQLCHVGCERTKRTFCKSR